MSSILLLPRHALSTRFSRPFGASIGLLMVTKVKWYINTRGNEKKVFAFPSIEHLLCALKPTKISFMTTESKYSITTCYYELKLISSYLIFMVLSRGDEDVNSGRLECSLLDNYRRY